MGLFTSVDGEVRVVAAPFCSLALTPGVVEVRQKDLDQTARFKVNITWEAGYTKPVYLMVAGFSEGGFLLNGASLMAPGKDYALVPNGTPEVDLEFDMGGTVIANIPFAVGAYEDAPEPT
ncbi:MAG: hypothetical protein IMZ54_11750 [Acidobacteria bacterium]|nr:hypothetical protein [Acidobacteriota bacterium]